MTYPDAAPRPARRARARATGVVLALAVLVGGAGCSLLPEATAPAATDVVTEPAPAVDPPAPADPAAAPVAPVLPPSAAQALAERVQAALTQLGTTAKTPNRSQLMDAMLAAGAVAETVELSIDITPTGLAVDAVEAATSVVDQCVIGQVRDGVAVVTIMPLLASGKCFVGDQH